MAKRKRLSPPDPLVLNTSAPETKSMFTGGMAKAPIADVASDAAATSALQEISDTLSAARDGGRMVIEVPLDDVQIDYIERDRVVVDDADMQALCDSLQARGQQTPVELVALPPAPSQAPDQAPRYGLISGWRRCRALALLHAQTGEPRFAVVQGLLRRPDTAAAAYLAMVEENEIRADLSYFERARIAVHCADSGVFDSDHAALTGLYANASRARRSKIGSFMPIVRALGASLNFPDAIGERLGLELAQVIRRDVLAAGRIQRALMANPRSDAAAEQGVLRAVLAAEAAMIAKKPDSNTAKNSSLIQPQLPGLTVSQRNNALTLKGKALTPELQAALMAWLQTRLAP